MEKSMNPHFNSYGGFDITGEWVATNGCYSTYYVKPYSYYCSINGERGNYDWYIYLCLTSRNGKNIKVLSGTSKTIKGAKNNFKEFLEGPQDWTIEIEEWKKNNIKPAFNSKFEHVGDFYAPYECINKQEWAELYDYYNDNPVKVPFKYVLSYYPSTGITYSEYSWNGNGMSSYSGCRDPEILEQLMSKLPRERYSRFYNTLQKC